MEQILKELPKKAKEKYNEHKKFFQTFLGILMMHFLAHDSQVKNKEIIEQGGVIFS